MVPVQPGRVQRCGPDGAGADRGVPLLAPDATAAGRCASPQVSQ
jgi:hypothetical protein